VPKLEYRQVPVGSVRPDHPFLACSGGSMTRPRPIRTYTLSLLMTFAAGAAQQPAATPPAQRATPATAPTAGQATATSAQPAPSPSVLCGLAAPPQASTTPKGGSGTAGNTGAGGTPSSPGQTGVAGQSSGSTAGNQNGQAGGGGQTSGGQTSGGQSGGNSAGGAAGQSGTPPTSGAQSGGGQSGANSGGQGTAAIGAGGKGVDACFASQAALGDLFEIRSSELAASRSGNAKVKAFAQQLIKDHTASSAKLTKLAPAAKLSLPSGPDTPRQIVLSALSLYQGDAFDRAFLAAQVSAHEEAVNLFTNYRKSATTAELRDFAAATLPALEKHLSAARALFKDVAH
jgi:putative membrane protein